MKDGTGELFRGMRARVWATLMVTLAFLAPAASCLGAQETNVAPKDEPLSAQYTVGVGRANVPVYTARIMKLTAQERETEGASLPEQTALTAFASFDLAGPEQVTVTCHDPVQNATIRPASAGITPAVSGNTITFTVSKPGPLVLDVNGDWVSSLQLFVNPPERDVPNATDPNVIYYGPGVHEVESVPVHSGQTVYLAPGAFVYGKAADANQHGAIFACKGANITVRGRGVIDGSLCPRGTRSPLAIFDCTDFRIEGVILRDSCGFNMPVRRCDRVKVDGVKIFGWRGNSDGMDICNSRDVEIVNCYLRTFDDLIVVKADKDQGPVNGICAHHCVLWNEFAHALSLGAELSEPVTNCSFSDCDIIHDKGREHLLRIYNCDASPVANTVFRDIRIEEARRVMSLWIGKAQWSHGIERGHIRNTVFQDITSIASERKEPLADLVGFDADHLVENTVFKNVVIGGKPLAPADVRQNEFVRNVVVMP